MTRPSIWSAVLSAVVLAGCAEGLPWPWPLQFDPPPAKVARPLAQPPGALNDAVTQANIRRTICNPSWIAATRPPAALLNEAKARLMKESAMPPADAAKYEVDFLVPLGLGGHPRKPENLWLQPVEGTWGVQTKDRLEAKLRHLVCSGEITLHEARDAVRTDWEMAARYYLSDRELLAPVFP
jgi:hypothetical protein